MKNNLTPAEAAAEAGKTRENQEIQYVDTDTEKLVTLFIKGYERICGKKLYPGDPLRLFILWIADIMVHQRVLINHSAKQNIPRFSEGENLDNLVEFLNVNIKRLEPQPARTKLRYTLSTTRETATVIPKGYRATVDGEITFATTRDLIIGIGELTGDVEAVCEKVGTIGNGFLPGQIAQAVDIVPYLLSVTNVTRTEGGAEREDDKNLYERNRESLATYSTAGPEGAYRFFAQAASATIADVKATSPTPGVAEIRILLENGEIPQSETLQTVKKILSADDIRPLTDKVEVKAPEQTTYNIDLTYYTFQNSKLGAAEEQKAVNAAVEKYKKWQSEKMGRDINPSMLYKFLMDAGVKRVEIRSPAYIKVEEVAVGVLGTKNVVNGGEEDE